KWRVAAFMARHEMAGQPDPGLEIDRAEMKDQPLICAEIRPLKHSAIPAGVEVAGVIDAAQRRLRGGGEEDCAPCGQVALLRGACAYARSPACRSAGSAVAEAFPRSGRVCGAAGVPRRAGTSVARAVRRIPWRVVLSQKSRPRRSIYASAKAAGPFKCEEGAG